MAQVPSLMANEGLLAAAFAAPVGVAPPGAGAAAPVYAASLLQGTARDLQAIIAAVPQTTPLYRCDALLTRLDAMTLDSAAMLYVEASAGQAGPNQVAIGARAIGAVQRMDTLLIGESTRMQHGLPPAAFTAAQTAAAITGNPFNIASLLDFGVAPLPCATVAP